MWGPGGRPRSAKADASRPKHSLLPNTSGVSTPMTRTFPIPLSQTVSPSVLRVTTAGCVEFDAVASGGGGGGGLGVFVVGGGGGGLAPGAGGARGGARKQQRQGAPDQSVRGNDP